MGKILGMGPIIQEFAVFSKLGQLATRVSAYSDATYPAGEQVTTEKGSRYVVWFKYRFVKGGESAGH